MTPEFWSPEDGSSHTAHLEDLDVSHATFASPDPTTFAGLDRLGLEVVGRKVRAADGVTIRLWASVDGRCTGQVYCSAPPRRPTLGIYGRLHTTRSGLRRTSPQPDRQ